MDDKFIEPQSLELNFLKTKIMHLNGRKAYYLQ